MYRKLFLCLVCCASASDFACGQGQPLAKQYLLSGELTAGEKALMQHLRTNPGDDQARFGLGILQFLQTFEHVGSSLHRYGLRSERAFRGVPPMVREMFPQNPKPETITYKAARQIAQTFVDDLEKAEATLAAIKDDKVQLPLAPGHIKIDLFGQGKPVDAVFLFGRLQSPFPEEDVNNFLIKFDRGDVNWLRGYCHFLAALGEITLSLDGRELFDCTAHLFFEKVETPYPFLLENRKPLDDVGIFSRDWQTLADLITGLHLSLRFELEEPARMKKAHAHLEGMLTNAKLMWQHYLAETDDDCEWIPNPKQTGVLRVPVGKDMVGAWQTTLLEAEQILQGKKLVPFWRGTPGKRGLNVRKVFMEPRTIDVIRWVQGSGAAPYLEEGEITRFADETTLGQLNRTFGGWNFFGFAFWFN